MKTTGEIMKKCLFRAFAALLLGFIFFSCSDYAENASLSFRISSDFARVMKNQTDREGNPVSRYLLKIKLQGGYSLSRDFSLSVLPDRDQAYVYEIQNLPAGRNIQVLAFLYSLDPEGEEFLVYMTENALSLRLSQGDNEIPLSLSRVKFMIKADGGDGTSYSSDTGFSGSGDVPYLPYGETLSFSLEDDSDAGGFEWRLNGNQVGNEKNLSLRLSDSEYVDLDSGGENYLSCGFLQGGERLVALFRFATATKTAAVYEDKISSPAALKQLSLYDSGDEPSELKIDGSVSDSGRIYTFDSAFNLWAVDSWNREGNTVTISRREISRDGLYPEDATETYTFSSGTPKDMCYDTESGYLYILSSGTGGSNSMTLHAFSPSEGKVVAKNENMSYNTYATIAVQGGTIYCCLSMSDCNVYKAEFKIDLENAAIEFTSQDATGSPFEKILDIASPDVFGEDYAVPNGANYSVADIQIGDGKGNGTDSLYALYREETNYINYTSDSSGAAVTYTIENVYSRGALVKIETRSQSYGTEVFGWTENSSEIKATVTTASGGTATATGYFYGPSGADSTGSNLYLLGPSKFAALVPRKLVFLDDGIEYTGPAAFRNKDSLVEFDIASKTLSRGASVKASKPRYNDSDDSGFTSAFTMEE